MSPSDEGVGRSCVALPEGPWATQIEFLVHRFPRIPPEEWIARMQRGDVTDARGAAVAPQAPFTPHAKLYYYRRLPSEPRIPFEETVLYQDDLIVVADKPHFLPVTPSGRYLQETLLVRLKRRLGIDTLAPVHRIDRETAGLVLFTVQPATRGRYQALFRERAAEKCYEAIAPWREGLPLIYRSRLEEGHSFMTMREAPGEPNAETRIELIERLSQLARYGLRPMTGKRHQLRVHMAALGVPIVNDLIYPVLQPDTLQPDYGRPLQLLARSLAFVDPVSGESRRFESRHRLAHADGAGRLP
ncbi:MAG TPA: pseudouridine synthase [Rhizobacter sp.]|nr:pseudouridine synthase [Rhizobacter sp.]